MMLRGGQPPQDGRVASSGGIGRAPVSLMPQHRAYKLFLCASCVTHKSAARIVNTAEIWQVLQQYGHAIEGEEGEEGQ